MLSEFRISKRTLMNVRPALSIDLIITTMYEHYSGPRATVKYPTPSYSYSYKDFSTGSLIREVVANVVQFEPFSIAFIPLPKTL